MKQTLYCLLQNRLGAMDRVLNAFTLRGWQPEQMVSTVDAKSNSIQLVITFSANDEKAIDLLVKALNKQVYVLQAESVPFEHSESVPDLNATRIASLLSSVITKRRISHVAHN